MITPEQRELLEQLDGKQHMDSGEIISLRVELKRIFTNNKQVLPDSKLVRFVLDGEQVKSCENCNHRVFPNGCGERDYEISSLGDYCKLWKANTEPEGEQYPTHCSVCKVSLSADVHDNCHTEPEDDHLASPDATWEELGRGFIEVEPDMSEGGK